MTNLKRITVVLIIVLSCNSLFSQVIEKKERDLSWNGFSILNDDVTLFGINWIYGADNEINGVQLNNIYGLSQTDTRGWQSSIFANLTMNNMTGIQNSLFYNYSKELNGVSFALFGINNTTSYVNGAQIGLIGNLSGAGNKFGQLGAINITKGNAGIGQLGIFSYNKGFQGVQCDLLSSISLEKSIGLQFSVYNLSKKFIGAQLGGVNYSDHLKGLQFGLINIADSVDGVQFGLINICNDMNGIPIGIIDIQKNGENHFYYTIEYLLNYEKNPFYHTLGYRFGSKYFYKSFNLGFRTGYNNHDILPLYSAGFNFGVRLPILNSKISFLSDLGMNICNWQKTIEIDYDDDFYDYLIPETKEMLEFNTLDLFGIMIGFKQRYYCDAWNDLYMPTDLFEFIKTPDGSLFIQNSLFIGIEY